MTYQTIHTLYGLNRMTTAIADPETGSDRYFLESTRMQQMGLEGWEVVRDQGIARHLEIQSENPYPET